MPNSTPKNTDLVFRAMAKQFHGVEVGDLNVREMGIVSHLIHLGYIIKPKLIYYAVHLMQEKN